MALFPPPPHYPQPTTLPDEPLVTQEDMDKLASALTEVVLLLRAGDIENARTAIIDASGMCGVRMFGRDPLTAVPDYFKSTALYGSGQIAGTIPPPDRPYTATEMAHRQRVYEQKLRSMMASAEKGFLSRITGEL